MTKLRCVCGEIIPISGDIPNVTEWHAMSDFEFDTFSGNIDVERLYGQTVTFYRCPRSDHIRASCDGFDHGPSFMHRHNCPRAGDDQYRLASVLPPDRKSVRGSAKPSPQP